jgi:ankyrin repeat protein
MCSTNGAGGDSSRSQLMRLPNEIIFEVAPHLQGFSDLNSLVRTSRFFHTMFNSRLYHLAVAADDSTLDNAIGYILSEYRLSSLTLLLDNGLSVKHTGKFAGDPDEQVMLRFLCKLDDQKRAVPLARLLIQRGANVDAKDVHPGHSAETVLYNAVVHNNCEMAALLLSHGADVNAVNLQGKTPLHWACLGDGNNAEIIHLLIAHGADIEARCADGETPLLWSRNPHAIAALLEHGADAGVRGIAGMTPLHWACEWFESEHEELGKSLLENGALVNATLENGETPLHCIVTEERDSCLFLAKFLLENGADVNAISDDGWSPLHCAIMRNPDRGVELIALLLHHGAMVNKPDESGLAYTPLHWLFIGPSRDELLKAKLLLDHGADVNAISSNGESPLQCYALCQTVSCKADLTALLLNHGADPRMLCGEATSWLGLG